MFGRKVLLRLGALAGVLALAACASNPVTEPVVEQKPVVTEQPSEVTGPEPGTQADLAQSAGDRVFFDYNQYNLTAQAQAVLGLQADWLQRYPSTTIRISGNCDERGTREYNLALGARRATAARNFLISQGIDASRITTISYGKERPIALGSNEAAWAQNRNAMTALIDEALGS